MKRDRYLSPLSIERAPAARFFAGEKAPTRVGACFTLAEDSSGQKADESRASEVSFGAPGDLSCDSASCSNGERPFRE